MSFSTKCSSDRPLQMPPFAGEREHPLLGQPAQVCPVPGLCLLKASRNQYADRLGGAACSCHAARALIQMFTYGIHDSATLDAVLDQGMVDYQGALRELGREAEARGAVLNRDFANGRFLGWSEARRFYDRELVAAGHVIAQPLQREASQTYRVALEALVGCSHGEAVGAMILVGYEFFSILVVPADGSWDVFFYDSHGSPMAEGNSFLAYARGLEEAGRVLEIRRPFRGSLREDYNLLTVYPLQLTPSYRTQTVGNRRGQNRLMQQQNAQDGPSGGRVAGGTAAQNREAGLRFAAMESKVRELVEGENDSFAHRLQKIGHWISDFVLFTVFHPSPALQGSLKGILREWMEESLPELVALAVQRSSCVSESKPQDVRFALLGLRAFRGFIHDYMQALQETRRGFFSRLLFGSLSSQRLTEEIVDAMHGRKGYLCSPEEHQRGILEQVCAELIPVFHRMGTQDPTVLAAVEEHLPALLGTLIDAACDPVLMEAVAVDVLEKGLPEARFQEADSSKEGEPLPEEVQNELIETVKELLQCSDPKYTARVLSLLFNHLLSHVQKPGVAAKTLLLFAQVAKRVFGAVGGARLFLSQTRAPRTVDLFGMGSTLTERWDPQSECLARARSLTPEEREGLPKRIAGAVIARIRALPLCTGRVVMQFSSIKNSVETLVERVCRVAQSRDLMRLFFYSYLIEDALIPWLKELNRAHPPLVRVEGVAEIDAQTLIGNTAQRMTEMTVDALRDYLQGVLLREDLSLNRALVAFSSGVMEQVLPPLFVRMIEGGRKAPSPPAQKMLCRSYGKLADFLQDFGVADQLLRADPGSQWMCAQEKEEALLKGIDLQRKKRGVSPLKTSPADQQQKLEALSSLLIAHATASFSGAEREAVEAVAVLFPKVLHRLLQGILSPDLFLRALESAFSLPGFDPSPLTVPESSEGWGQEALQIWNQNVQKILLSLMDLGECSGEYGYLKGIADEAMIFFGKEAGVHPFSLVAGPHRLSSAKGYASFTHILSSLFWKLGQDGGRVASLKNCAPLSAEERTLLKAELKGALGKAVYRTVAGSFAPHALRAVGKERAVTEFCDHIGEKLFFLTQSPKILEALVYHYLLEDLFPEIVEVLSPNSEIVRASLRSNLPRAALLDQRGLYWEILEQDVTEPYSESFFEMEILQNARGLSSLFSLLKSWSRCCPELKEQFDLLRRASGDPGEFERETKLLLRRLVRTQHLQEETLGAFDALVAQREYAVVFALLDDLLFPGDFDAEDRLLSEIGPWLENPRKSSLLERLSIQSLQNDFSRYFRAFRFPLHRVPLGKIFKCELEEAGVHREEAATLRTIGTALKTALSRCDLELADREEMQSLLGLLESDDPLSVAIRIFRGKRNLAYWEERVDAFLAGFQAGIPFSVLNDFYKKFCALIPDLLAFPMHPRERVRVLERLREKFAHAVTKDVTPLGMLSPHPHTATVFQNSVEGIQQKLALIREAEETIFLSGCYLGGNIFDRTMGEMQEQLERKPRLKIRVLGSNNMLTEENQRRLKALKRDYPDRFEYLIHPEVFAYSPGAKSGFTLNSNHVKIMIIDHGKKFLVGGSGIADAWANHDGTREDLSFVSRPFAVPAFRDTDFLVHSPDLRGVGRRLHTAIHGWFSQLKTLLAQDKEGSALDPGFLESLALPAVQYAQEEALPVGRNQMEHVEIKAYLSGPMKEGNLFFEDLVHAVDGAQESIHIDHMYFHPPKRLLNALIAASNRGVGIILVTNKNTDKRPWTHALFATLSKQNWQELYEGRVKQNVSVFEYDRDYTTLHKKMIVIDGRQIFTGSSNIGKKSLESLDVELDLMMLSGELGERVVENIIEDASRSVLVPEQEAPVKELSTAAVAFGQSFLLSRFL